VHRGHSSACTRTRAQVLLKLGDGWSDRMIAHAFDICRTIVKRVRARFLEGGEDAVLTDTVQEHRHQALTGAQQVHVIAIARSPVPEGHDHWTLRLRAGKAVELGFVASISPKTVRAQLRSTRSSRGSTSTGASRR
jgi:transposase